VPPEQRRSTQIQKFNEALNSLRSEVSKLQSLGQHINAQRIASASLNVGQLEIMLEGVADLEQFRKRFAQPITAMSLNPLFEYHNLRKSRIVQ
jgi:hypothetical protein